MEYYQHAMAHITPRERYLWNFEEEVEEILADAYQHLHQPQQQQQRETVQQRQARLEFVRRQEFARRLAIRGLHSQAASEYAVVRLISLSPSFFVKKI